MISSAPMISPGVVVQIRSWVRTVSVIMVVPQRSEALAGIAISIKEVAKTVIVVIVSILLLNVLVIE